MEYIKKLSPKDIRAINAIIIVISSVLCILFMIYIFHKPYDIYEGQTNFILEGDTIVVDIRVKYKTNLRFKIGIYDSIKESVGVLGECVAHYMCDSLVSNGAIISNKLESPSIIDIINENYKQAALSNIPFRYSYYVDYDRTGWFETEINEVIISGLQDKDIIIKTKR